MVRSILLYRLQSSVTELGEAVMDGAGQGPAAVVERLVEAINAHDLEAMVACFADDMSTSGRPIPSGAFGATSRSAATGARSLTACPICARGCRAWSWTATPSGPSGTSPAPAVTGLPS